MKNNIDIISDSIRYKLFVQNIGFILISALWFIIDMFDAASLSPEIWKTLTFSISTVILRMGAALKEYGYDQSVDANKTIEFFLQNPELIGKLKRIYFSYIAVSMIFLFSGFVIARFIHNNFVAFTSRIILVAISIYIILSKDKKIIDIIREEMPN